MCLPSLLLREEAQAEGGEPHSQHRAAGQAALAGLEGHDSGPEAALRGYGYERQGEKEGTLE